MNTDKYNFIAFLSLIAAIVILSSQGMVTRNQPDLAIMTGLIGVLGTFRPSKPQSNVEKAETVNQGQQS